MEEDITRKQSLTKKISQNLDELKNFTVVSTLAAYGGFSFILGLFVLHNKIFLKPSLIFLVFFYIGQHDGKVV